MAIDDADTLARYVLDHDHYSRTKNKLRPRVFLPPADLRLSVFVTTALNDGEVTDIGQREVAEPCGRTLHGWAHLDAGRVRVAGLDVISHEPPVWHAHIVGWPVDKDARTARAQELARVADLCLLPRPA